MLDEARFVGEIDGPGYSLVTGALPAEWVRTARGELERAIELEAEYHGGRSYSDFGMVLMCSLYGRVFIELFDIPVVNRGFNAVLGEGCIVYAYTSSSMPPGMSNYSYRIHVDCPRLIPNYRTNMGAMFLLDDFTEENGGTWFLPGSQYRLDAPSKEEFFANAKRLIAPAGSIFFFDPRLWHSGGMNVTDRWRHSVTLNMCRPWMKQRIDMPRAMAGIDLDGVSERALQKLGYRAQVPANYDEYYAPLEQRKYRQKTE
jgi:ectoine hydroxylase-related dioxygenase (phytanoyl-CoA dioxygenase family)